MDIPLHDNSKLMMDSPGQNTFVQNQINQLTGVDHVADQPEQPAASEEGGEMVDADQNDLSESNLDLENLTESQIMAL